ncbi:hypothetical protein OIDMADRAFT_57755 [Oidiodendron maius Zn]|uniref:Heterokaryon incompatibility domain-containing protein n=1 Tax=Oidiodendron maius (strain Zn) TaxID=913774 RepID=A0A0C3D5G7_OIDMZ|nr:hypothetical protein OIDMADRAFT_57755 [Oidiodendron maius Zn]
MAANESRRRADPALVASKNGEGSIVLKHPYHPLEQNIDCTRFVKIEPAENDEDPIVCTLVHKAFSERPKFEALSYMWGDESIEESILLDGVEFGVRRNLRDALGRLRNRAPDMLFWIDAISINQQDIPERNRQLCMMSHIYFRASTVVIWLGNRYLKYQGQLSELKSHQSCAHFSADLDVESTHTKEEAATIVHDQEREMVRELIADGYWNRLWIVQEIGRAEKKQVCFGDLDMTWDSFIRFITMHSDRGSGGPLKLAKQLIEKHIGAHTFRRLLEDHRHAECKEPRDTIYGLVGLAVDGHGFPMDYNKSLMEVWTDTMEFMNGHGLFQESKQESDIMYFGSLVKSRLMNTQFTPLQQLLLPYKAEDDSNLIIDGPQPSINPKAFKIKAYVLGSIGVVGPSSAEIASSLRKVDQWTQQVQKGFKNDINSASLESDRLISKILNSKDTDLARLCSSHVSGVRWDRFSYEDSLLSYYLDRNKTIDIGQQSLAVTINNHNATGNAYLYQIHNNRLGSVPWKMGITSAQAQPGDLICWDMGTNKAFVVRLGGGVKGFTTSQIFGTALATNDLGLSEVDRRTRSNWIWGEGNRQTTYLKMDAATIFIALS